MKNIHVLVIVFLLISSISWSQEKGKKNYFENGKPIAVVFANLNSSIGQGDNSSGYEVKRVYLGYQFDLGEGFSTKLLLDIGSPNDVSDHTLGRRFAYFKNAYLQYEKGKMMVQFGIIPTRQFKTQKGIWGHRYIMKTIMNEHKMGSSADLGATIIYKANKFISFDVGMMNGEGYAKIQNDNSFKLALGTSIKPTKGLLFRFYVDAIQKGETQINWVNFVSYNWNKKIIAGIEYNIQFNSKNVSNQDLTAISTYLSYNITEKWQLFGRYDIIESNFVSSNYETPWNLARDGSQIVSGLQFQIHKKVKAALDYQVWIPRESNKSNEQYLYLNVEFKI